MNISLLSNPTPVGGVDDFDVRRAVIVSVPLMYELWGDREFTSHLYWKIREKYGLLEQDVDFQSYLDSARVDGIKLSVDELTFMVMEGDFDETVTAIIKAFVLQRDIDRECEDIVINIEDSDIGL